MDSWLLNPQNPGLPQDPKKLVMTKTGEPYQPVRIYYQVFNQKTVLGALKKLRCMDFDTAQQRWLWLYEQEAKKLRFDVSYRQLSKDDRPLILAVFTFFASDQMILDCRSFDRAIYALEFFDKRINYRAATPTRIRIANRFFEVDEMPAPEQYTQFLDRLFEREDIKPPNFDELEAKLKNLAAEQEETERAEAAITAYLEEIASKPLPEVEELPLHVHEDGITTLALALRMRQTEALEHWRGNTSFSQLDILSKLLELESITVGEEEAVEVEAEADEDAPET
jgi:hypothetical protein